MQLRRLFLALALCAAAAAPAAAVSLDFLTNPTGSVGNFDLTTDGSRAVANFSGQVYLLDDAGNFTPLGILPTNSWVCQISADGATIVTDHADTLGVTEPVILRESEGWAGHVLPTVPGYVKCDFTRAVAKGVNGDGTMVTGMIYDGCTGKAFLWTETTGMQDLGQTMGRAISRDGSVIGGFSKEGQEHPVYWTIDGSTVTGPILLHHELDYGQVHDVTTDGQVMVGTGLPYGYDPILTGFQAFRYEMGDTNFTLLGTLSGSPNDISKAYHVSDNGMIIGTSGPTSNSVTTFVWTPTMGMTSLKQYLTDEGIPVSNAIHFTWPKAFSTDGSTLIGEYIDLYGGWGYYRVDFGGPSPVENVVRHTARLTDVSPNPFNPMTTVRFSLERSGIATVTVYDIAGRRIDVLADREFSAGEHELVWRGKDGSGREMPSGSYIVRLESAAGADSRTISLVR